MELETQIRNYLEQNLLYRDDDYGGGYDNETSFIGEGLIDSTGFIELVTHVQAAFGIPVEQQDLTPDNFDSVNRIAAFIRRKQAEGQGRQGSSECHSKLGCGSHG